MATVWSNFETMNIRTKKLLNKHTQDLNRINQQRRLWLYASSVVLVGILFLIFTWDWIDGLHSKSIWWLVVSTMLIISVNWWYWTMRVIKRIIEHQEIEFDLIRVIMTDIREVKKDIQFLAPKNIDKQE